MRTFLIGLSMVLLAYWVPELQYRVFGLSLPYTLGGFMIGWGVAIMHADYKRWKNSGDRHD